MAHFAELDQNNIVLRVIVVANSDIMDNGQESEAKGIAFCKSLFGQDTNWVQTSYTGKIRKRYAGVGYSYDSSLDAFIPPQPYPSWHLDPQTCDWAAPIPMPNDGAWYIWDESNQSWVKKVMPDVHSVEAEIEHIADKAAEKAIVKTGSAAFTALAAQTRFA